MNREELWQYYRQGISQIESNPDEAVRMLGLGSEKATEYSDAYMKVLFDHWQLQALIIYKHDFKTANQLAITTAIDARDPVYMNFREYICIQQDLILVYQGIDPVGYAPEIKEAIDLMLDSTSPNIQCHRCLKQTLVQYHIDKGEIEQAANYAMDYFMSTEYDNYHRAFAVAMQCQFAFWKKEYDTMLNYARIGINLPAHTSWEHYWLELKAWEMLALENLGQHEIASNNFSIIESKVSQIRAVLNHRFYYAVLAYHETRDDTATAMSHWKTYLNHLKDSGENYWECLALIEYIRLLKQENHPIDEFVTQYKSIAVNMKSQSQMLAKLETALTA